MKTKAKQREELLRLHIRRQSGFTGVRQITHVTLITDLGVITETSILNPADEDADMESTRRGYEIAYGRALKELERRVHEKVNADWIKDNAV
jgi:hypothetical protein